MEILEIIKNFIKVGLGLLDHWQTLVGSLLGPFLAFLVGKEYEVRNEKRKALRKVEASITRSLNESFRTRKMLKDFKERLLKLIKTIRNEPNENIYNLSIENFPPISTLTSDAELSGLNLSGSLYLHNKLLWIATGINNNNTLVQNLRPSYQKLYELNKPLIEQKVHPTKQRDIYASNLENYSQAIDNLMDFTYKGIEIMTQTKVYNLKLIKGGRRFVVWWYEGVSFKYFRNKIDFEKYSVPLNMVDRIDKVINKKVIELIAEAERREKAVEEKKQSSI